MQTNRRTLLVLDAELARIVAIHYESLRTMNGGLPRLPIVSRRMLVIASILGAMGSHLLHIMLFTAGYALRLLVDLGAIVGLLVIGGATSFGVLEMRGH